MKRNFKIIENKNSLEYNKPYLQHILFNESIKNIEDINIDVDLLYQYFSLDYFDNLENLSQEELTKELKKIDNFIDNRITFFTSKIRMIKLNEKYKNGYLDEVIKFLDWLSNVSKIYDINYHKKRYLNLIDKLNKKYLFENINKRYWNKIIQKKRRVSFTGKNKFSTEKEPMIYGDIDKEIIKNCSILNENTCDGVCFFKKEHFWGIFNTSKCVNIPAKPVLYNTFCSEGSYKTKEELIRIIKFFTYDPNMRVLLETENEKNKNYKKYYSYLNFSSYENKKLKEHSTEQLCKLFKEILTEMFNDINSKTDEEISFFNNLDINTVIQSQALIDKCKKLNLGFRKTFNRLVTFIKDNKTFIPITSIALVCMVILFKYYNTDVSDVLPSSIPASVIEQSNNAEIDQAINTAKKEGYNLLSMFINPIHLGVSEENASVFNNVYNIIKGYVTGILPSQNLFSEYLKIYWDKFTNFHTDIINPLSSALFYIALIVGSTYGNSLDIFTNIYSIKNYADDNNLKQTEEFVSIDDIKVIDDTATVSEVVPELQNYYHGFVEDVIKNDQFVCKIIDSEENKSKTELLKLENNSGNNYLCIGSNKNIILNKLAGMEKMYCNVVELSQKDLENYYLKSLEKFNDIKNQGDEISKDKFVNIFEKLNNNENNNDNENNDNENNNDK